MEKLYGSENNDIILPNLIIPNMTDEELAHIYKRLKPIVTIDEIKYYLKEYTLYQLRYCSYIESLSTSIKEQINPSSIDPVDEFICFHKFHYYGSFVPKIAEVLAQVPENLVEDSNAFEILEYPTKMAEVTRYYEVFEKGYHLSKVRTYRIQNK